MLKNKIRIVTLVGYFNYGNRLQNYALSNILRKIGYRVKTPHELSVKHLIYAGVILRLFYKPKKIKEHYLYKFTRKHIGCDYSWFQRANYVVVGSDQVWNPDYIAGNPSLLEFSGDAVKISYAASIGTTNLTEEQKEMFSKALKKYKAISVREKSAKDLLQPLVPYKKIEVVLDPTLLLDKAEYIKLEKRPKDVRDGEKYILCYILGDQKHQEAIKKYADKNELRIITFSDRHDSNYGVEEFLYLVHHAELICTDSFHACVFSFIFDRPFVVFKRSGKENYMYTRLQNLLDTFSLKNREYNGTEITGANILVDYTEAKKILAKEREKSINYLKEALGGNE